MAAADFWRLRPEWVGGCGHPKKYLSGFHFEANTFQSKYYIFGGLRPWDIFEAKFYLSGWVCAANGCTLLKKERPLTIKFKIQIIADIKNFLLNKI